MNDVTVAKEFMVNEIEQLKQKWNDRYKGVPKEDIPKIEYTETYYKNGDTEYSFRVRR